MFLKEEEGIRVLVRFGGVGGVYRRHSLSLVHQECDLLVVEVQEPPLLVDRVAPEVVPEAVSYTHLTLPTSDLV